MSILLLTTRVNNQTRVSEKFLVEIFAVVTVATGASGCIFIGAKRDFNNQSVLMNQ